jgi:tryptophanyl-tRNA synthetase
MANSSKRILSGMRTSGSRLHLGNYEGALKNWVRLQDEGYTMFCMVADWHALTTLGSEPVDVRRFSQEIAKDYVAAGLDPSKTAIFIQSDVKEHAELHLLFSMVTGLGKLERVPTFKEKRDALAADAVVSYGLLGYPVLQSADILLYRPYGVPVGKDQAAHLELSREIARSFNAQFGEVFPEFINIIDEDELRSKLPGLDTDANGNLRKMSKSYNNCIYLNETPDETASKIKSAFTTPTKLRKTDPGIPEGCAVCQYLKAYAPDWETLWEEDRQGLRGCMQNKSACTEVINEMLRPIRERRAELDDETIQGILKEGAERARSYASSTMDLVRSAMKLV